MHRIDVAISLAVFRFFQPMTVHSRRERHNPLALRGDGRLQIRQDFIPFCFRQARRTVRKVHRAKSGDRILRHSGGVVIVKKDLWPIIGQPYARLHPEVHECRKVDLARRARIDDVGNVIDKVETSQRIGARNRRQLLQIKIEAEVLRERSPKVQVNVQSVAVDGQGECLILDGKGVVIRNAKGVFDDALDLANRSGGVLFGFFEFAKKIIDKREHILERPANDWHHHRIERLIFDRVTHHFQTGSGGGNDVAKGHILEVEHGAQVGQDNDDIVF